MNADTICLLAAFGAIGAFVAVIWLDFKIWEWFDNYREAKRKKEYPHLFELVRERDALSCKIGAWYRNEILPRKKEIDLIVKEDIYWPENVKAKKRNGLEQLRNELYAALMEDTRMEAELAGLRTKIADYVVNHDLKWAKERGWDDC